MSKKLLLFVVSLLLAGAPNVFASVGVFDFTADIGNPLGIGQTIQTGDDYLIYAGGGDIWGTADQFHYSYNEVTGNVRVSASFAWQDAGWNDWAKMGVMLRESTDAGSIHYSSLTRKGPGDPWALQGSDGEAIFAQRRESTAGESGSTDNWHANANARIGVQRVQAGPYEVVQALVDYGAGWESYWTGLRDLPDTILAGAAVTAHDDAWLVTAYARDVEFDSAPGLVGVRTADPLAEACGTTLGFMVSAAKMPAGWDWWDEDGSTTIDRWEQYQQAEYLVKNNGMTGYPALGGDPTEYPSEQSGSAYRALVNLHDSGGRWVYANDASFPGIDAFQQETTDPADGDDDERFGVLVEGCIELTAGLHVFGGVFDDGILIRIGGVEIGRTNGWDETGQFLFEAPVAGVYSLEAIGFEGGGGAQLELYEWLDNNTMVLMGDVANGASPVYIPEPATIALLGIGTLALIRRKR
jgi:hypothetical protein